MRHVPFALACASVLALADSALAHDFRVNRFDDQFDGVCDAHCSLRDAISAHNQMGQGPNRILLPAGTFQLSLPPEYGEEGEVYDEDANLNGDLDVLAGSVILVGAGRDSSIIDGGRLDRLFEVASTAVLDVRDLTLRNGFTSTNGGAIENRGQVIVRRSRLADNLISYQWDGQHYGGAIYNEGTLVVYDSLFQHNVININDSGSAQGGALFNAGRLQVRDTLFENNVVDTDDVTGFGAALFNIGEASMARVAILGGRGDGQGTAVRNDGNGVLTLSNATITGSGSQESETDAAVSNGSDHWAYPGSPRLKLLNVTIAGNGQMGLYNDGFLELRNSIIVDNPQNNCVNYGTIVRSAGLLLGSDSGNCPADLYVDEQAIYGRVLYALRDNGAGLPTFSLPPVSPALDSGVGMCPTVDQRGYPRPQDGDGDGLVGCDLGAYERGPRVH
ncbi:CSLREA domain-containing protein [Pseudomonas sp. F(2018)]|uniref:CSLREA domain-containing protein n=1 Tax=Pseudomonas sp. F(2018) TaxID=2502240 RepID=UPI0010F5444A|nr:CSLREA domain-containing protein [Pseudomonas sp. F(2018)]